MGRQVDVLGREFGYAVFDYFSLLCRGVQTSLVVPSGVHSFKACFVKERGAAFITRVQCFVESDYDAKNLSMKYKVLEPHYRFGSIGALESDKGKHADGFELELVKRVAKDVKMKLEIECDGIGEYRDYRIRAEYLSRIDLSIVDEMYSAYEYQEADNVVIETLYDVERTISIPTGSSIVKRSQHQQLFAELERQFGKLKHWAFEHVKDSLPVNIEDVMMILPVVQFTEGLICVLSLCVFLFLSHTLLVCFKGGQHNQVSVKGRGSNIYKNILLSLIILNILFKDVESNMDITQVAISLVFINNKNYDKDFDILSKLCVVIEGGNATLEWFGKRIHTLGAPLVPKFGINVKKLYDLRFVVSEVLEARMSLQQVSNVLTKALATCVGGISLACSNGNNFGIVGGTPGGLDKEEKVNDKDDKKSDIVQYVKGTRAVVMGMELIFQCLLGIFTKLSMEKLVSRVHLSTKYLESVQPRDNITVDDICKYVKRYENIKVTSISKQDIKKGKYVYWFDVQGNERSCIVFNAQERWMGLFLFTNKPRFKKFKTLEAVHVNYGAIDGNYLDQEVSYKRFEGQKFTDNDGVLTVMERQALIFMYKQFEQMKDEDDHDCVWEEDE